MSASLKIFITGANGSLGTKLINQLLVANEASSLQPLSITALALDANDTNNLVRFSNINIVYGDICRLPDKVLQELSAVDIFVHLAALVHSPKTAKHLYYKVNYEATQSLFDTFAQRSKSPIKQFIFISTVSVYGNYKGSEYSEDDPCHPETPYAESKLMAESYIIKHAADKGLNYTIVRPATIYGNLDRGNIGKMIRFLHKYHVFPLFNDGKNMKSLLYVGDVARAIIRCFKNQKAFNKTFNLSTPPVSMVELIAEISIIFNIKVHCLKMPLGIFSFLPVVKKIIQNNVYSRKKAEEILQFMPLSVSEGLRKLNCLTILEGRGWKAGG